MDDGEWFPFHDAPRDGRRVIVGGWLTEPSTPNRKIWFTTTAYYGYFNEQNYKETLKCENSVKEWIVFGFITLNNFPCVWTHYKEQIKAPT